MMDGIKMADGLRYRVAEKTDALGNSVFIVQEFKSFLFFKLWVDYFEFNGRSYVVWYYASIGEAKFKIAELIKRDSKKRTKTKYHYFDMNEFKQS
jgi:hypothetical protein